MALSSDSIGVFGLEPQYREYVWGGNRLRPGQAPTAEAWIVYEGDLISSGPLKGQTLSAAAQAYGPALLGEYVVSRTGMRFPLLVKLLDCAQWLSLQVHPNDRQAVQLEGPGQFGKTEAWYILEADPGAKILWGLKPGVQRADWQQAVRDGSIIDYTQSVPVKNGDTIFIPAGTLHALGPGLLVYEVQQVSDITYRVFDWNRPASSGRKLHIEQSLEVIDPQSAGQAIPQAPFIDGGKTSLITCPYFTLERLTTETVPLRQATQGKTFHTLTVIEGQVRVEGDGWGQTFNQYETAVIPAASQSYQIRPLARSSILKASVEETAG